MRRWLSGLLAALTLFSLTACGGLADLPEIPEKAQVEDAGLLPAEEAEGMEDPTDTEDPGDAAQEEGDPALPAQPDAGPEGQEAEPAPLPEAGSYITKEDVALYIYTYGHLPGNFITKKEAQNLGWPGGDLEPYAPGKCIGGSRFGNYEGLLPDAEGRTWTECDIDTLGAGSRGAKRVVFSNDGLNPVRGRGSRPLRPGPGPAGLLRAEPGRPL